MPKGLSEEKTKGLSRERPGKSEGRRAERPPSDGDQLKLKRAPSWICRGVVTRSSASPNSEFDGSRWR